ncbi:glycosyltransferase family 1 protein [Paenibacillus sp. SZ31]|uniref:glycosyltransferase n=1 Tax=Paenibacillus sp. SZ31 TaxID=2725555 RepID=UPI00146CA3AD|nr:glycosyltransferase family 1 protein [Paenibacillus sp. SZ31]
MNFRIAYIMHVEWDWIKQRPHFLYEELTKHFSIDLFPIRKLYTAKRVHNNRNVYRDSQVLNINKLPYSGKIKSLKWCERFINSISLKQLHHYDVIWITSPLILEFIPKHLIEQKKVVYDCMDDFTQFYCEDSNFKYFQSLERELLKYSDLIIASSNYLKEKLLQNYGLTKKVFVINNGISTYLMNTSLMEKESTIKTDFVHRHFNIIYFGTVSNWMDFDLILQVLNEIPEVKVTIIGPIEVDVPNHPRLEFLGLIEHDQLKVHAEYADAFIMPFILNDLIRSVDPVKMYEYIFFMKPILSINYEEMIKFLPFVQLYETVHELVEMIRTLIKHELELIPQQKVIHFLEQNTWEKRAKQISELLHTNFI